MKRALTILLLLVVIGCHGQTVNDLRPTVTMKEYVDMNVDWQQKYYTAQLNAQKEANELVRLSLQEYKTQNNEWRGQLKDQAGTFVTWPALLSLIFGVAGLLFGYSNYKNSQIKKREGEGKNIVSGDRVEVKK